MNPKTGAASRWTSTRAFWRRSKRRNGNCFWNCCGKPARRKVTRRVSRPRMLKIGRAAGQERVEFRRVLFRSHQSILAKEQTAEWKLFLELLWETGAAQSDAGSFKAEDVEDRKSGGSGESGVQTCALPISPEHFGEGANGGMEIVFGTAVGNRRGAK